MITLLHNNLSHYYILVFYRPVGVCASVNGLVFYCLIECHWSVIERKNYVSDAVAVDQTDMKFVTISIKPIPLGKPTSKCVTNITK